MNPDARPLHQALTTASARSRRTVDHSGGPTGKNSCRRPARIVDVDQTRLAPLIRFHAMLYRHLAGVLAWTKHRLTNAALEGNNSRVRGLSHRARGYRNPQNLMVVLYHASWA